MKIGIIAAMEQELVLLVEQLENKVEEKLTEYGLEDWTGLIKDIDKSIGDYINGGYDFFRRIIRIDDR